MTSFSGVGADLLAVASSAFSWAVDDCPYDVWSPLLQTPLSVFDEQSAPGGIVPERVQYLQRVRIDEERNRRGQHVYPDLAGSLVPAGYTVHALLVPSLKALLVGFELGILQHCHQGGFGGPVLQIFYAFTQRLGIVRRRVRSSQDIHHRQCELVGRDIRRQPAVIVLFYALDQRMGIELRFEGWIVQQGQYALLQRLAARINDSCDALIQGGANQRHHEVDKADADCQIEIRKRRGHTHTPNRKRWTTPQTQRAKRVWSVCGAGTIEKSGPTVQQ